MNESLNKLMKELYKVIDESGVDERDCYYVRFEIKIEEAHYLTGEVRFKE